MLTNAMIFVAGLIVGAYGWARFSRWGLDGQTYGHDDRRCADGSEEEDY